MTHQEKIDSLLSLSKGWDCYDADPPNTMAANHAQTILERGDAMGIHPLKVLASAEGGIFILYTAHASGQANMECYNDGTVYAARMVDSAVGVWSVDVGNHADIDAALTRMTT